MSGTDTNAVMGEVYGLSKRSRPELSGLMSAENNIIINSKG